MTILAWIAIIVPLLAFLALIIGIVTDGFKEWAEVIYCLVIPILLIAMLAGGVFSAAWGFNYLHLHQTQKPIHAENP